MLLPLYQQITNVDQSFFFFNGDGGSGIDFKDLLRMCSCNCHQSANAWLISVHYV